MSKKVTVSYHAPLYEDNVRKESFKCTEYGLNANILTLHYREGMVDYTIAIINLDKTLSVKFERF